MSPKFAIGLLIVFILVGAGTVWFFWLQSNRAVGLDIDIQSPPQVLVGVPFDLSINVSNESGNVLQQARLAVSLPDGLVFIGDAPDNKIEFKEIGNIGAGGLSQHSYQLMAVDGARSIKKISAVITYLPGSVGARFEKKAEAEIAVGEFGLPIDIVTPTKVLNGENFETIVSFRNDSDQDFSNLRLVIDYPAGFTFIRSTAELQNNHREWMLGDLRSGSKNEFKITGNLSGPDSTISDLKISIEADFSNRTYSISSNTATIAIAASPVSVQVTLNGANDYIAQTSDVLRYAINYSNNTDIALRDVVIKAKLTGAMFDFTAVTSRGSFRSVDNTIIWNASNQPELALIQPNTAGRVDFEIRTQRDYPIRRLNDKNFTLQLQATLESPTVPAFVAAQKTVSTVKFESNVAGRAQIDTKVLFRDAVSGVVNAGPFPPRVNQATQYTVHWIIKNYSTDISNIEVRAFLGPNTRMTKVVKSSILSQPAYNESTQEVSWKIDKIIATKGAIGTPVEAIFQIEAIPSEVGQYWTLIQDTNLTANDDFTGQKLSSKDVGVSTALPDDPTITSSQGIVKP